MTRVMRNCAAGMATVVVAISVTNVIKAAPRGARLEDVSSENVAVAKAHRGTLPLSSNGALVSFTRTFAEPAADVIIAASVRTGATWSTSLAVPGVLAVHLNAVAAATDGSVIAAGSYLLWWAGPNAWRHSPARHSRQ